MHYGLTNTSLNKEHRWQPTVLPLRRRLYSLTNSHHMEGDDRAGVRLLHPIQENRRQVSFIYLLIYYLLMFLKASGFKTVPSNV